MMECPTLCPNCDEVVEHETMKPERRIEGRESSSRLICRECFEQLCKDKDWEP